MTILYITFDGVTDHIGRSQVAPYVLGLARLGFKIHILSAEKSGREELVGRYRRLFEDAAIRWTRVNYSNRPQVAGQAQTLFRMRCAARRIAQAERVQLTHCRCFPPSLIGWDLKRTRGTRFLYDFRDFYADNILVKSRGLKTILGLGLKQLEGPMIRAADKIVCLTERAAAILAGEYLKENPGARQKCQVIPCCADFSHFNRARLTGEEVFRAREKAGLGDNDFVLLYLGSLGPDYLLEQMMALFAQLLMARPNAKFLFLSNNGRELVEAARVARGVPVGCVSFASADRDDVPAFLAIADMSVVFIRADASKAGCSPTKLAELFACDVPVIANAGVGDMDSIIDPRCNGSVLVDNFSDKTLRSAVEILLAHKGTTNIRENSRTFDLQEGVDRYAAVYSQLVYQ